MQINPQTITQTLTVFIGNLPTFIAVVLAWMHSNGRFSDAQARTSDLKASLEGKIEDKFEILRGELKQLDQKVDHTRELLRAEFMRVEEVLDARIKHLEERD